MKNTVKLLFMSAGFSVLFGVLLGLTRGELIFDKGFPAFYIICILSAVAIFALSYFAETHSYLEEREGLCSYMGPNHKHIAVDGYKMPIIIISLFGSGLVLIAAVRGLIASVGGRFSAINTVFVFACAFSLLLRALDNEKSEKTGVLSLFPIFYLCFYLLIYYRDNARSANEELFGPQAITVALLIFAAYLNAAVKFEPRRPMLRFGITFLSLSLCIGDAVAYLVTPGMLTSVDPSFYLTLTGGFSVFFTASLFAPGLRLFKPQKRKTK